MRKCLLITASSFLGAVMFVAGPVSGPLASPLAAQGTLSGTVVESGTGTPVEGASVNLLGQDYEQVAWRLTDAAGRFSFGETQTGTYTLRADRIGHLSIESDLFTIQQGANVVQRLETPVEAIVLAGIEVSSSRRCEVRPGQGMATATVWEEARKALEATTRTSGRGLYRYMIRRYEREWDPRVRRVRSEQSRILRRQVLSSPFRSLDVEDLLDNGFVRPDGDGSIYYAPSADVLLSDEFLDTHCMSLEEGDDEAEGLLGLSFEPTEDRGVPEISGVLWLDPEDGELQWMDYRYEYLDVPNSDRLGGKIRFAGLPNGTWIVREWYIRMPLLGLERSNAPRGRAAPTGRMETRLIGIREEGGLVVQVNNLQGDLVLDSRAGIIEGVVFDSGGAEPVEGVVVLLDDSTRVMTDEDGRFRFTGLVEGYHGVRAVDLALDSLGLSSDAVFLEARSGDVTSAILLFRSLDVVLMDRCGPDARPRNGGILTGLVSDPDGDAAVGARISIEWQEIRENAGRGIVQEMTTTSEVSDDGLFLVCGLPRDRTVNVTVEWNGIESPTQQVRLVSSRLITRQDITIPEGR